MIFECQQVLRAFVFFFFQKKMFLKVYLFHIRRLWLKFRIVSSSERFGFPHQLWTMFLKSA